MFVLIVVHAELTGVNTAPNAQAVTPALQGITWLAAFAFVAAGTALGLRYAGCDVGYAQFLGARLLRLLPLFVVLLFFRTYTARGSFSFLGWLDALLTLDYLPTSLGAKNTWASPGWLLGPLFQLYLLFPFIHRFSRTEGMRWLVGLLLAAMIGRFMGLTLGTSPTELNRATMLARLDQFCLGYVAGSLFASSRANLKLVVLGLCLGGLGLALRPATASLPRLNALLPIVEPPSVGLVIASAMLAALMLPLRLARLRLEQLVALLYPCLLFFLPVIDAMRGRGLVRFSTATTSNALLNALLLGLPGTLLAGWAAYTAFELPFRAFLARNTKQKGDAP